MSKKQIKKIIALLPKRYQKMDCNIYDFKNKFHLWIHYFFTNLIYGYSDDKNTCGTYNSEAKNICCYSYRINNKKYIKQEAVLVLLHELRHCYQHHYFKGYEKANANYIDSTEDEERYLKQWIEVDARKFSKKFMNKHKNAISKILRVDTKWKILDNN